jgi:hypothetical protein
MTTGSYNTTGCKPQTPQSKANIQTDRQQIKPLGQITG